MEFNINTSGVPIMSMLISILIEHLTVIELYYHTLTFPILILPCVSYCNCYIALWKRNICSRTNQMKFLYDRLLRYVNGHSFVRYTARIVTREARGKVRQSRTRLTRVDSTRIAFSFYDFVHNKFFLRRACTRESIAFNPPVFIAEFIRPIFHSFARSLHSPVREGNLNSAAIIFP